MTTWENTKAKWINELRYGDWVQGRKSLVVYSDEDNSVSHCCLGVLACMMTGNKRNPYLFSDPCGSLLSKTGQESLGVPTKKGQEILAYVAKNMPEKYKNTDGLLTNVESTTSALAILNDCGFSFDEIAEVIEVVL